MDPPNKTRPSLHQRARLSDVATLAGVSTMTVARVLRQPLKVAEATRIRVQTALRDTGYTPDLNARGLASRKSGLVAAIVPLLTNSLTAEIVQGLTDVMAQHDVHLLIGASGFSAAEEEALIREFLSRRVDGIYLSGTSRTAESVRMLSQQAIPVVEGGNLPEHPIDMVVGYSNVLAAAAVTRHLIDRRYDPIGYIGANPSDNDRARDRRRGFQKALHEAHINAIPKLCIETKLDLIAGAEAMKALLRQQPRPRAVFCSADVLAVGAMFECQRQRVAVPGQIAIAGFDDLDIAGQFVPALTTLRIQRYEIGRRAGTMITDRLAGRSVGERVVDIGFELIVRDSA
jgi:LacI family transcriptional regulator, gluconate utilization system Gnt-I transcriptional repressor